MDTRLDDREWLASQYATRSLNDIASSLGCSPNTVRNRLVAFDIPRRNRGAHFRGQPKPESQRRKMAEARKRSWQIADRAAIGAKVSATKRAKPGSGVMESGYHTVYVPGASNVRAHRAVIEKLLGRKLATNEVVHHIDHDKTNNDPSNLVVLSPSEHAALHNQHREIDENGRFR